MLSPSLLFFGTYRVQDLDIVLVHLLENPLVRFLQLHFLKDISRNQLVLELRLSIVMEG